jgi:hypothetical protein
MFADASVYGYSGLTHRKRRNPDTPSAAGEPKRPRSLDQPCWGNGWRSCPTLLKTTPTATAGPWPTWTRPTDGTIRSKPLAPGSPFLRLPRPPSPTSRPDRGSRTGTQVGWPRTAGATLLRRDDLCSTLTKEYRPTDTSSSVVFATSRLPLTELFDHLTRSEPVVARLLRILHAHIHSYANACDAQSLLAHLNTPPAVGNLVETPPTATFHTNRSRSATPELCYPRSRSRSHRHRLVERSPRFSAHCQGSIGFAAEQPTHDRGSGSPTKCAPTPTGVAGAQQHASIEQSFRPE